MRGSKRRPLESFFEKGLGCWLWRGAAQGKRGLIYGVYRVPDGRLRGAHAVVYEYFKGPIKLGLEPDHLCRNTLCVRPDHLELVTHKINVLRGTSPGALNAKKTQSSCGHPYTGHDGLRRYCKPCRTKWFREYYHRNRKTLLVRQKEYRHAI